MIIAVDTDVYNEGLWCAMEGSRDTLWWGDIRRGKIHALDLSFGKLGKKYWLACVGLRLG